MTSLMMWNEVGLVVLYSLILVTGLLPNLVLTYLIFTREFMRVKYIFTVSISLAHIVFCLTVVPIIITYSVTRDVRLERPCHVFVCLTMGVTSYSMLTTAIRRALALSERYRYADFTSRGKVMNVVCICALSLTLTMPFAFYQGEGRCMYDVISTWEDNSFSGNTSSSVHIRSDLIKPAGSNRTAQHVVLIPLDTPVQPLSSLSLTHNDIATVQDFITEQASSNSSNSSSGNSSSEQYHVAAEGQNRKRMGIWIYSVILLLAQIMIPAILSLIIQTHVCMGIKRRPNQTHWIKELRITKQHIYMVVLVSVCWLPILTFNLVSMTTVGKTVLTTTSILILRMFQIMAVSYVVYFPVLYFILNAHIQREVKVWLQSFVH